MKTCWRTGNHVELLENGEEFFPRVFETIRAAQREVLLETFILEGDAVGRALERALIDAARRGVRVELTLDAWGSMRLPTAIIERLTAAGVCVHLFHLVPAWRLRIAWFRRLHRKLIVIDGVRAFVGGINFAADQVTNGEPGTKQDYATEVRGPVVTDIHALAAATVRAVHRTSGRLRARRPEPDREQAPAGDMIAGFVARDNVRERTAIERQYRHAIAAARKRVIVANAYFFPGYRLLHGLRHAARRGVDVRLVLQGEPDLPWVQMGARMLYDPLLQSGVRIYEYCRRPFHGKVAVVDDEWATVGSSNLDPLSLALNLEANIIVRDRRFTADVSSRLERLMVDDCTEVTVDPARSRIGWRPAVGALVYHFLRHFPQWSGRLPAHTPRLTPMPPGKDEPPAVRQPAWRR